MKKAQSIKTKVFLILLALQIPTVAIIGLYNVYFINYYNEAISEKNRNMLFSYCSVLEDDLGRLDEQMLNFVASDNNFKMLARSSDVLSTHLYSYDIMSEYRRLLNENRLMYGCYIWKEDSGIYRECFAETAGDYEIRQKLRSYVGEYIAESSDELLEREWHPVIVDGHPFLLMVKGYCRTYCIYVLDVDRIRLPQEETAAGTDGIVLFHGDLLLNDAKMYRSQEVRFTGSEGYYFTGERPRYLVIERPIRYARLRAAYVMRYEGFLGALTVAQRVGMLTALALAALVIPGGYYLLKKVFFRPVDALVAIMNEIKEGKLELRVQTEFTEKEFRELKDTFNDMINQINRLKIEAYEKELNLRQTQLDYFQIQIRPHFYVNCLKSIYGLLEEHKNEQAQESIICLSKHLRYMLKGATASVTLSEELQYVTNYMELQQMSMAYPPECVIETAPEVQQLHLPAISILSFVENAVKYGSDGQRGLKIGVFVSIMEAEGGNWLNIQISDNGVGFSESVLQKLNSERTMQTDEVGIGIYNVMQRFYLFFGKENVLFAFSNMDGANIDIFVKRF